jgi:ABC-type multidrug transport system permease subunit
MGPLYIKLISAVVYGLLVGSMFYDQPQTTEGMYSRGGVLFYSSILLAWLQMSELEDAMQGRDILSRQKKFAFVRPSAVCLAQGLQDMVVSALLTFLYLIVLYFLSGLRSEVNNMIPRSHTSANWSRPVHSSLIFCLSICAPSA